MTTLFNYWHFIVIGIIFFIFVGGIVASIKQKNKKLIPPMIISISLICLLFLGFSIVVVDKYTKIPKLYKMKNKRLLSIEKIVYTGIVRNEGNHEIGKVTFEIKLVNKGHVTGNIKGGSYFKPSGFMDFFKGGSNILYRPQSITKEFIVARNLRPGEAKSFRVYFDWPPYFRNVSHFGKVYGH
ncbi:DUF2393 family protein [Sulfurimonas sp.]|uniref:DUF2393 family protein n=1 Tax=Sulfurimonas sp. TaxID=2022749 RepID=UPI002B4A6B92|nr:DUF2393 family protein [Sulfurimonas sp.]